MAIKFEITGDNSGLLNSLNGATRGVRKAADNIEQSGLGIENLFESIQKKMMAIAGVSFAGVQLKQFISDVVRTRGEFEQLEVAFSTMLQSKQKADALMNQLINTAAKTPFDLKGVADGAKQLLAYGIAAEDVNDTLIHLGDIAAGLGLPLKDLVYLYGTTMVQGRMFTMDLRQFMGRGIPMAEQLAKQFGVAKSEVADLVTAGKVTSDDLKKAIYDMTGAGSQFGGLMENQSKTVLGQISNIEDAIDSMYNDIGKSQQGVTKSVLCGISFMVEHYQAFGKVLADTIALYGSWKAGTIVTAAWSNMQTKQANNIEKDRQNGLQKVYDKYSDFSDVENVGAETAAESANTDAQIQNTASRKGNVTAIDEQIAALQKKILTEIDDQDAIIANSQKEIEAAGLKADAAQEEVQTLTKQAETAKEYLAMCNEDIEAAYKSGDAKEIEAAKSRYNTAAKEAENAEGRLAAAVKNQEKVSSEKLTAEKNLETATTRKQVLQEKMSNVQKSISVVQTKAQTAATGIWVAVTNMATKAMQGLKMAVASNPLGAALVGITTIISLLPLFSTEASAATAEIERFGESAVKQSQNVETLFAVIDNTSNSSTVHKNAVDELCKVYEEYGFHIDSEQDKLEQLVNMHGLLTEAIKKEGEERQKANLIASYDEANKKAVQNMRDELKKAYSGAEWNGSGILDDWDATEYQKEADDLTQIVGGIIESESEGLSTLTGDKLEQKINEVNDKITEAYQNMRLNLSKTFSDSEGNAFEAWVDVDAVKIMKDYAESVHRIHEGREALIKSFDKGTPKVKEEAKEVDYATMSLEDLVGKLSETSSGLDDVDGKKASPSVDSTEIDHAKDSAEQAKTNVDSLNGAFASPKIDTSSVDSALTQTNMLMNNLAFLQGMPLVTLTGLSGTNFQTPKAKVGGGKNGLNVSSGMLGFNFNTGPLRNYNPYESESWKMLQAYREKMNSLQDKAKSANTNKKVADLLKEVNSSLDNAEFGSMAYKELDALKKRLEAKTKKDQKTKSGKTTAGKVTDEKERYDELNDKTKFDRIRTAGELETQVYNARLSAMENGEELVRLQREQANKEEIQQIEQQKEDAIRKYIEEEKSLFEQQEKIKEAQNPKYKKKKFDESTVDTSKISSQYDKILEFTRQKQEKETNEESKNALRDYLKSYGDYNQKKLAIAQEYDEKIKNAHSEVERVNLGLQKNDELAKVDEDFNQSTFDWQGVFNDLDSYSVDYLEKLKQRLKAMLEDKNITPENAKVVSERINTIEEQLIDKNHEVASSFGFVIPELEKQNKLQRDAARAQEAYNKALEDYNNQQSQLSQTKSGIADLFKNLGYNIDESEINTANSNNLINDFTELGGNSEELRDKLSTLAQNEQAVSNSANTLSTASNQMSGAMSKAGGSFASTIAIIDTIIQKVNENVQSLPQLMDEIGIKDSGLGKGLDAFAKSSQYATDAWNALKSGNAVGVVANVLGSLRTLGDSLGEFGISIFGSSDVNLARDMEELTASNQNLSSAINMLAEEMEDSPISDAPELYYKQKEYIEQEMQNSQQQMIRSGAAYSKGFLGIGGKHSSDNKVNEKMSKDEWKRISDITGKSVNSASDFWKLSSSQMRLVAMNATDLWTKIKGLANDGYADASQYMDDYIVYQEQLNDLTDTYYEKITSISFDSWADSFKSNLLNMQYDVSSAGEEIGEIFMKGFVNSLWDDEYKEKLHQLYLDMASDYEDNGTLDKAGEYRERYEELMKSANEKAKSFADTIGYTSEYDQKASSKGFQSMNQDTGEELNGRFTAIQISTGTMAEQVICMVGQIQAMTTISTSSNSYLQEIRNMMITSNSYLEDIGKYTKKMYLDFSEKIDNLVKNTKNL